MMVKFHGELEKMNISFFALQKTQGQPGENGELHVK